MTNFPRQDNSYDCGLYVIEFIERHWFRYTDFLKASWLFTPAHIGRKRANLLRLLSRVTSIEEESSPDEKLRRVVAEYAA